MGIELPTELAGIAERVELRWPHADEDAMLAQARAWRNAESELDTLSADADGAAENALAAFDGRGADAARQMWSGFVEPDSGHLTGSARGAGQAAQRLEHAAEQIGAAKVEMLRQLTEAAKNEQAARSAAAEGNQQALLGLRQHLKGVAVNLNAVHERLVEAVGSTNGQAVPGVAPVVDARPGARGSHGQAGLLGAATGLPRELVEPALDTASGAARETGELVRGAGRLVNGGAHGIGHEVGSALPGHVGQVGERAVSHAEQVAEQAGQQAEQSVPPLEQLGRQAEQSVPPVEQGPEQLGHDALGQSHDVPGPSPAGEAEPGTGPLALGEPTPRGVPVAHSGYGGLLADGGFDEAPTPSPGIPLGPAAGPVAPSGTTAAGFAGGVAPPAQPVPQAPPVAPAPGAHSASGYPVGTGSAAPGAASGSTAPPGHAPSGGAGARYGAAAARGAAAPAEPLRGQPRAPAPARAYPAPSSAAPVRQPAPQHQQAPAQPAQPAQPRAPEHGAGHRQQDRQSVVALFLVHMFPIGHLPVPSARPARQLPVPAQEVDYAAGLRFPPHDHPESGLIDSAQALRALEDGARVPQPPPTEVLPAPPAELTVDYDPLAAASEHEWERRYVARPDAVAPEYAWPPGEMYPEGGRAAGEPVVLSAGTMLDRFGTAQGRVFAADGTPYPKRSLPPSHLHAGYRRYQVLRELPLWLTHTVGWFDQPGGGPRYRAIYSATELVTLGYLADVTFQEGGHER